MTAAVIAGSCAGCAIWLAGKATREHRRRSAFGRMLPLSHEGGRLSWLPRSWSSAKGWQAATIGGALVGFVLGRAIGLVVGGLAIAMVGRSLARRRDSQLADRGDEQLADAVRSIAAGLRASLSVPQSLAYAASEAGDPLGGSLRTLVDGLELGIPLDDALSAWGEGSASDDVRLLSGVLRLHRRSGGDLPMVLDQVATTLGERRAAAREVRALTAQARLSGAILGFLPIGFFAFLWLTSRRDIQGAFHNPIGIIAVVVGLALDGVAFIWIRRLLEVR